MRLFNGRYRLFASSLFSVLFSFGICAETVVNTVIYDNFEKPVGGYALSDYYAKWNTMFGPGEMAPPPLGGGDTRVFSSAGMHIEAAPFKTAYDFGVFDHIKYFAVSNESFSIPAHGFLTFSADIVSEVPGITPNHVVHGVYTQSGAPYSAVLLNGQQAAATLHMIDFKTGQLFDWFVAGDTAFVLTERLPSTVTGSIIPVGPDKMYTQIIKEFKIKPGMHNYAIQYRRNANVDKVQFTIDGNIVASVQKIGIPLDAQHKKFITYPSIGSGELIDGQVNNVVIAHGLFSLLDAFPFQHPDVPALSVSIPLSERIFGQGVKATFDNFKVTTVIHNNDDTEEDDSE